MKRLVPLTKLTTPILQRTALNFVGLGNGTQQRFLAMKTPASGRSPDISKSTSAKRTRSASPDRESAKGVGSKRRASSVTKAKEAEKKAAQKEKDQERRERKVEQDKLMKERKQLRKQEKRERKLAKQEELIEKRLLRRAAEKERREDKKDEAKVKARTQRTKAKEQARYRKRPPGSPVMPRNPRALHAQEKLSSAGGASMPEKMKTCAAMYTALTPAEKKPYEDAAAADKVRYQKEFAAWRVKNPEEPKRPKTGYLYFYSEQHAALKSDPTMTGRVGILNLAKIVAGKWKSLSDKEKQPYLAKAAKDSERYATEKEAWNRKMHKA
jgi:hypothetical protein